MTVTALDRMTTSINPATEVGPLALSVSDLDRSLAFYTESIGLRLLERNGARATLGVPGRPLLHLVEELDAAPWPRGGRSYTGLYHFAILLPTRPELGRWLRHWLECGMDMPGQGDHNVSEALYLDDPDGHGIEVYRDRPRSEWRWVDGRVQMGTGPVDIRGVIADSDREGKPWTGMPAGTTIGHIHLQVGDIEQAAAFYHGVLGFDIVASLGSALFVSAGGYHHHIGMNIWHSSGAGPAPEGVVRLRSFTIALPSESARAEVVGRIDAAGIPSTRDGDSVIVADPWGNEIHLRVGTAA
jgi:catechol 2,3-dioxygenase